MIRVEANPGETILIEWFFTDLGLSEATVRSSHLRVDVCNDETTLQSLNNINGAVLADIRKQRIRATIATEGFAPGVYSVWVDVLRGSGARMRKNTHTLAVIRR